MELYEALKDIDKGRFIYFEGCDSELIALASGVYTFTFKDRGAGEIQFDVVLGSTPKENAETIEREYNDYCKKNYLPYDCIYSLDYKKLPKKTVYAILGDDENGEEKELFTGSREEIETLYKELSDKYETKNNGVILPTKKGFFKMHGYGYKATTKEINGILEKSDLYDYNADTLPEYSDIPADICELIDDENGHTWIKYNNTLYSPHRVGRSYLLNQPIYAIVINGINRELV